MLQYIRYYYHCLRYYFDQTTAHVSWYFSFQLHTEFPGTANGIEQEKVGRASEPAQIAFTNPLSVNFALLHSPAPLIFLISNHRIKNLPLKHSSVRYFH